VPGGSYGTILGATIAAMFPSRIGHMVLDGVLDVDEYYHDSAYVFLPFPFHYLTLNSEANYIFRSDTTFTAFFNACANNPSTCAFARPNTTGSTLESEFYAWLYDLKYLPLGDDVITVMRYTDIKAYIRNMLYAPSSWPAFSLALKSLYDGNVTAAYIALGGVGNPGAGIQSTPEANFGIRGADKTVRRHELAEMKPFINKILATSQSIGDISALVTMVVAQWKVDAVEVYGGDFRVKTKNPVLVTSNTWDPVAPLEAAEKLNGLLGGSGLLVNDGYGVS
jgi:pimeloyl-ACP methyl ester carboxylesterase